MSARPVPLPYRRRLAAWGWLLLTLASGVLLRYQWTGAAPPLFDSRYLLHAHSHVALLGWAFVGVATFLAAEAGRNGAGAAEFAFHLLVGAIFVAFLLQGYAFWSILLSMVHVAVSFVALFFWVRRLRPAWSGEARAWLDLSMLWFALAQVGPWLLALGGRMGEGWIEAWVGFYLALLFHGWLACALVGCWIRSGGSAPPPWTRTLLAVAVLPAALPRMTGLVEGASAAWAGWVGSVALGVGFVGLALHMLRPLPRRTQEPPPGPHEGAAGRALLLSMGAALLLAGPALVVGAFPPLAEGILGLRNLMVGYVHLLLLGFMSAGLLLLLRLHGPGRRRAAGVFLFLAGGWGMTLLLLGLGAGAALGRFAFWPVAWTLTLLGGVALAGTALLLPKRLPRGV